MPSLEEAMRRPDMSNLERIESKQATSPTPPVYTPPQFSPMLRCPMPIATSTDAQRQYYRDGVPQTRIITPASIGQSAMAGA